MSVMSVICGWSNNFIMNTIPCLILWSFYCTCVLIDIGGDLGIFTLHFFEASFIFSSLTETPTSLRCSIQKSNFPLGFWFVASERFSSHTYSILLEALKNINVLTVNNDLTFLDVDTIKGEVSAELEIADSYVHKEWKICALYNAGFEETFPLELLFLLYCGSSQNIVNASSPTLASY